MTSAMDAFNLEDLLLGVTESALTFLEKNFASLFRKGKYDDYVDEG